MRLTTLALATLATLALTSAQAVAQVVSAGAAGARTPNVEFDMMTWPEVKAALDAGKTTALVYNGGTEQRGPQNVNGGHTLMAREISRRVAVELGNAIVAPVLPFSPNNASAELPGTIGLTNELFAAINEQVVEQLIITGFKSIVLMGDHGGGQQQLREVAEKLDAKHRAQGIRVVYCDDVYQKAGDDFDRWMEENGYPASSHAGIPDTSEMMYLGGDRGWVRLELVKDALGDPVLPRGQRPDTNTPRLNNGIRGDARRSSVELGKMLIDMKVEYAVRQIHELLG
jgi:creatinine amidohydrolase